MAGASGKTQDASASPHLSPYFFIPNLIGYGRVIFAFVAFHYAYTDWTLFMGFYFLSAILDAFDGMAARHFNQSSQLGAVLDMVTDRFGSNILLAILAHLYLDYAQVCFALMVLDLVSHWAHMYASLLTGSGSHKDMSNANFFIRLYYKSRIVLFTVCAAEQLVYAGLYVMYFTSDGGPTNAIIFQITSIAVMVAVPLHVFKQGMNFLQLYYATEALNEWDFNHKATKAVAGGAARGTSRGSSRKSR
ncbi:unnamed protein product [Amoebophrya sp. A120]|nr:unnamed protein product [Amoebophrya sp. A120]|eukprot:GSA120T00018466001.1